VDRSNEGSEDPRQDFDGFGELLTTCAAVNRLLVVAATDLQLVPSPALSFRTHSQTTTSQRHPGHFWSTDGSLVGSLRVVLFAASNLLFTVRFRLSTIIRYPSMLLWSSAIQVPPSVRRASGTDVRLKKGKSVDEGRNGA
jgi:hypothetical protein